MATKWIEAKFSQCMNKCFEISGDSKRLSGVDSDSSSKRKCAICLKEMKRGRGQAFFTGECSHSFHFRCITSSVSHGNQSCPLCRAQWKEVPAGNRVSTPKRQHRTPTTPQQTSPTFDDDDVLPKPTFGGFANAIDKLEVKAVAEVSEVEKAVSLEDFAVLIHLKAPVLNAKRGRAPIDLVTVLDVSGSMQGLKIDLMKRAMAFVIENLGPSDRLSVVAFSSNARRVSPLRLMRGTGKEDSVKAVNSLIAQGGTNIHEGLKIGSKVILDRRWKNPVAGIIVLSDGHDNSDLRPAMDAESLIPGSIRSDNYTDSANWLSSSIPVHTFGFGTDHDARLLHSVSEISRGTFSFVKNENAIQDAFAQCIGGLQSVVIQDLAVEIECANPRLQLRSIKSGCYRNHVRPDRDSGWIQVGDLYAEEERDFLAIMKIPSDKSPDDYAMTLLNVTCVYKDSVTKKSIAFDKPVRVEVFRRTTMAEKPAVSIDVDRHRNRFLAAQVISGARVLAERGNLEMAAFSLDACKKELSESVAAKSGDSLTQTLLAELAETQKRMSSVRVYENSGRSYIYSSISSHLSQRATARGDSTEIHSSVRAYQNASMTRMLNNSREFGKVEPEPEPNQNQDPVRRQIVKVHKAPSLNAYICVCFGELHCNKY